MDRTAISPREPSAPAVAPRAIARDLPCRGCGYNLRGLFKSGRCPECGMPVIESTRPAGWSVLDERQLRRIRLGAIICIVETILAFISGLCVIAGVPDRVGYAIIASPPFILTAGVWLLTKPFADEENDDLPPGRLSRIAMIVALVAWEILLTFSIFDIEDRAPIEIGFWVFATATVVAHLSLLQHLLRLSRRVSKQALTHWLFFLRIGFACTYAALLFALMARSLDGSSTIGLIALSALSATLLFGIIMLIVLGWIAGQITDEVQLRALRRRRASGQTWVNPE